MNFKCDAGLHEGLLYNYGVQDSDILDWYNKPGILVSPMVCLLRNPTKQPE